MSAGSSKVAGPITCSSFRNTMDTTTDYVDTYSTQVDTTPTSVIRVSLTTINEMKDHVSLATTSEMRDWLRLDF